jgi:hypothetical protein
MGVMYQPGSFFRSQPKMNENTRNRENERGSAGVKFAITLVIILLVANAGYNYVPIAYEAESVKSEMQTAVLQGMATPGKLSPVDNVKARIQRALTVNNVPGNAVLEVKQAGNSSVTARVAYRKDVHLLPFGLFNYPYVFDHTATPSGFLLDQETKAAK